MLQGGMALGGKQAEPNYSAWDERCRPVDPACEKPREGEVSRELRDLEGMAESVYARVVQLADRLTPVLRMEPATEAKSQPIACASTGVGSRIQATRMCLSRVWTALGEIETRLEL